MLTQYLKEKSKIATDRQQILSLAGCPFHIKQNNGGLGALINEK